MPATKLPKKPKTANSQSRSPELALIDSLAEILNNTGLSEIELEQKGVRVRVSRNLVAQMQVPASGYAAAPIAAAPTAPAPVKAPSVADMAGAVKSPMVGTAYLASAPGSPDFVTIGATVKQGQTLLIIEAMKTMNQIPAPRSGKVTQIIIETGQPVEFGEVLMVIE